MELYDFPITSDRLVSMSHGPVNSTVLNLINGMEQNCSGWEEFVRNRTGYNVGLAQAISSTEDLDELSEAELLSLNEVWEKFGRMTQYQIRDWTHMYCPEWRDPNGSSVNISYARVLAALGKGNARELADAIEQERQVKSTMRC